MGYRHYLYKISNDLEEKLRGCEDANEFTTKVHVYAPNAIDEDDYVFLPHLSDEEVYNFGKWYGGAQDVYATGRPMFDNAELQEQFSDYEPYIVGKEGMLAAIQWQRKKIGSLYEDLLREESEDPFSKGVSQFDRMKSWISDYSYWWNTTTFGDAVLNLKEDDDCIVSSWLFEHTIFELVRIYKTFDWEHNSMIFMGW